MNDTFDRIISALTAVNDKKITDKNEIAELLMLCHIDLDKELSVACKNAGIKRDDLEFRIRMLSAVRENGEMKCLI